MAIKKLKKIPKCLKLKKDVGQDESITEFFS